LQFISQHT